jgi:hypothetical protein
MRPEEIVQDWWFSTANFCGCGRPGDVMALVLKALEDHGEPGPEFDGGPAWDWNDARTWLLGYSLDAWELTEHGGGVGGAWLTDKGMALRDALRAVDFTTVLDPLEVTT